MRYWMYMFVCAGLMIGTLVFSPNCKPSDRCVDCLVDCDLAKEFDWLSSDVDCFDWCVFREECEPELAPNFTRPDSGVESVDAGRACWQACPVCEFPEDPGTACADCRQAVRANNGCDG